MVDGDTGSSCWTQWKSQDTGSSCRWRHRTPGWRSVCRYAVFSATSSDGICRVIEGPGDRHSEEPRPENHRQGSLPTIVLNAFGCVDQACLSRGWRSATTMAVKKKDMQGVSPGSFYWKSYCILIVFLTDCLTD